MKLRHKIVIGAILSLAIATPAFAQVDTTGAGTADVKEKTFQIVPCTGVTKTDAQGNVISGKECDFNSLIEMANRIIKFLLYLSIPFILGIIIYTAFMYLTSNGSEVKLTQAKHMLKYVVIGLIWILVSFILVYTVLDRLLDDDIKNDQQGIWNSYLKQ